MDEKEKKEQLKKIPTRQLVASIKHDIRRILKAAPAEKPKKRQ